MTFNGSMVIFYVDGALQQRIDLDGELILTFFLMAHVDHIIIRRGGRENGRIRRNESNLVNHRL